MIPDNVTELERRRMEHRERDVTVSRMQQRIVALEAEVEDLRRQLAASFPLHLSSFPHGP